MSSVNDQEWVEQRRYCVRAMGALVNARSAWVQLVKEEVTDFVLLVQGYNEKPINIFKLLLSSVSNNITSLVFGERLPIGHPDRSFLDQGLDDVMKIFAQAGLYSYLPWLVKVFIKLNIGTYAKSFDRAKDFNNFIRREIEAHMAKKELTVKDFIDGYLEEMDVQSKIDANTTFKKGNLIGNAQALFTAGTDTIKTLLTWLIAAMATYPEIQKKVHRELDSVMEDGQKPSWEDCSRLPFTYAVILECNRWKTVIPLNPCHLAREDIKVGHFVIPKGSTILANIWAVHNDKRYWKDPEDFVPERFLQNGGREINLRRESYIPFSYGKRNCPGEQMAMIEIFLYFSSLMQRFEIRSPRREGPCLDAVLGLTYKPVHQEFCFISRRESTSKEL